MDRLLTTLRLQGHVRCKDGVREAQERVLVQMVAGSLEFGWNLVWPPSTFVLKVFGVGLEGPNTIRGGTWRCRVESWSEIKTC